jgi:hypothetical protein
MTLFSCARRGVVTIESTTSRVSTTVSISAASTIRRISACESADLHELGALELDLRRRSVDADDRLDAGSRSSAWASRPPQ